MPEAPPAPALGVLGQVLPEPLLLVSADGRIADANPAACQLFGRTAPTLRDAPLAALTTTAADAVAAYLRQCAGSRQLVLGGLVLTGAHGDAEYRAEGAVVEPAIAGRPALLVLRLRSRDSASNRFRLLSDKIEQLSREVVQRMRAESILERQRQLLEMIAQGAPLSETLDELVRTLEQYSSPGLAASILLLEDGRYLRDAAAPSLPQAYRRAIDGIEIGPGVGSCGTAAFRNEAVIVSDIASDPLWRDFRDLALAHGLRACWSTPIRSRAGEVLGTFALYYRQPTIPPPDDARIVEIIKRTTAIAIELRQEEKQIRELIARERQARGEAEAANRDKDEFLAMISHELRNPLNAMMGWLQVLSVDGVDAETVKRGFETIKRNAEIQSKLISDTLDFARITSNRLRLNVELLQLDEVVAGSVASMQPQAQAAGVELHLECPRPVAAAADRDRIQQVVGNLLSNAIRFTPAGGQVRTLLEADGDRVRLEVSDDGEGIAAEFLPHVFERFRQADASETRRHGGLGLGLSVVRYIVEAHGGTVRADSDGPGTGATFTVNLPRRTAAVAAAVTRPAAATADISAVRVLVVDDEADARALLDTALTRYGAQVTTAASAADALACVARQSYDVVISDIAMPVADGYSLMRSLRAAEQAGLRTPAIALTAFARDSDRQRALEAGYDEHLAKPVDHEELVAVIARLAGHPPATA